MTCRPLNMRRGDERPTSERHARPLISRAMRAKLMPVTRRVPAIPGARKRSLSLASSRPPRRSTCGGREGNIFQGFHLVCEEGRVNAGCASAGYPFYARSSHKSVGDLQTASTNASDANRCFCLHSSQPALLCCRPLSASWFRPSQH